MRMGMPDALTSMVVRAFRRGVRGAIKCTAAGLFCEMLHAGTWVLCVCVCVFVCVCIYIFTCVCVGIYIYMYIYIYIYIRTYMYVYVYKYI